MLLRNWEVKRLQGLSNWMQKLVNAFKIYNSSVLNNSFFYFSSVSIREVPTPIFTASKSTPKIMQNLDIF